MRFILIAPPVPTQNWKREFESINRNININIIAYKIDKVNKVKIILVTK